MEHELLVECADWIAAQLEEEGYWVDAGLIQLILEKEQHAPVRIPSVPHRQAADHLATALAADGVQGVPDAVDASLITIILQWEDEFLALAGRPRE